MRVLFVAGWLQADNTGVAGSLKVLSAESTKFFTALFRAAVLEKSARRAYTGSNIAPRPEEWQSG
ncbi:MAG: hypothetical protein EOM26_13405 [Alphaproteobacteria bacterium]|nr:hypothetical protein [Alphaproteobacteria bacterium]